MPSHRYENGRGGGRQDETRGSYEGYAIKINDITSQSQAIYLQKIVQRTDKRINEDCKPRRGESGENAACFPCLAKVLTRGVDLADGHVIRLSTITNSGMQLSLQAHLSLWNLGNTTRSTTISIDNNDFFAATRARASTSACLERFAEARHRGSPDVRLTQIGSSRRTLRGLVEA